MRFPSYRFSRATHRTTRRYEEGDHILDFESAKTGKRYELCLGDLLSVAESAFAKRNNDLNKIVWSRVGSLEVPEYIDDARVFHATFAKRNYPNLQPHFSIIEGEEHVGVRRRATADRFVSSSNASEPRSLSLNPATLPLATS